jgi:hypothetical protein
VFCSPSIAADAKYLPEDTKKPGVLNPNVTQANIGSTTCKSGWTKTIRPPASFTNHLKQQQLEYWGYRDKTMAHYEQDHRVPLEIGGHPKDQDNLWPEPWTGTWNARVKDKLENRVKRDICAGQLTLAEGRAVFTGDWIDGFKNLCGSKPSSSCARKN